MEEEWRDGMIHSKHKAPGRGCWHCSAVHCMCLFVAMFMRLFVENCYIDGWCYGPHELLKKVYTKSWGNYIHSSVTWRNPTPRLIIAQFENLMNTNLVIDFIYFVSSIRLSVFFRVLSIIQGFTGRRYSRYLSRTISGYGFDGKCTATVARRVPFSTSNLKTSIGKLIARAFGTGC